MDRIIGEADPAIARAFVAAAFAACDGGVGATEVVVDVTRIQVAVKPVDDDEQWRVYFGHAVFKLMLRVDMMGPSRTGRPVSIDDADRLITRHEGAMNALWRKWDGLGAPFAGRELGLQIDDYRGDSFVTSGRWRASLWVACRALARREAAEGKAA